MHSQIHTVKNHGGVDACVKEVCNLDAHKSICRFVCIYICYVYSHRTEFLNLKGSLMTKDNVFIVKKQTQWANVKSKIIYSRIPYMYLPVIMILKTKTQSLKELIKVVSHSYMKNTSIQILKKDYS